MQQNEDIWGEAEGGRKHQQLPPDSGKVHHCPSQQSERQVLATSCWSFELTYAIMMKKIISLLNIEPQTTEVILYFESFASLQCNSEPFFFTLLQFKGFWGLSYAHAIVKPWLLYLSAILKQICCCGLNHCPVPWSSLSCQTGGFISVFFSPDPRGPCPACFRCFSAHLAPSAHL